ILGLTWLFVMAATSHDFWLKNLSPRVWKNLHMGVYVAYGLLVGHVALGLLQGERSPLFVAAMALGVGGLTVLHIGAGFREMRKDRVRARERKTAATAGFAALPSNSAELEAQDAEWVDAGDL